MTGAADASVRTTSPSTEPFPDEPTHTHAYQHHVCAGTEWKKRARCALNKCIPAMREPTDTPSAAGASVRSAIGGCSGLERRQLMTVQERRATASCLCDEESGGTRSCCCGSCVVVLSLGASTRRQRPFSAQGSKRCCSRPLLSCCKLIRNGSQQKTRDRVPSSFSRGMPADGGLLTS